MSMLEILKDATGGYEVNRVVGAIGSLAYIVCANAFAFWDMWQNGAHFDVTAYCLAFPGGLAVAVGGIAGSVAIKDRNVAQAHAVTMQTTTGGGI